MALIAAIFVFGLTLVVGSIVMFMCGTRENESSPPSTAAETIFIIGTLTACFLVALYFFPVLGRFGMSLSDLPTWTTYELIDDGLRVIAAVSATIAAIVAFNAKNQIKEVHISINSRMDALLKLTASASHAEGMEQARVDQGQKDEENKGV